MKFLLDSHALIWYFNNDKKLPESARKEIRNPENTSFVSIVALWEISIKYSLRKLTLENGLSDFIKLIETSAIQIIPVKSIHLLRLSSLEYHHRDPFDRLIIAQAQVENLTIITKDPAFSQYNVNLKWN
jgi:PIN domain nuclease of toxin-antitoxin system